MRAKLNMFMHDGRRREDGRGAIRETAQADIEDDSSLLSMSLMPSALSLESGARRMPQRQSTSAFIRRFLQRARRLGGPSSPIWIETARTKRAGRVVVPHGFCSWRCEGKNSTKR